MVILQFFVNSRKSREICYKISKREALRKHLCFQLTGISNFRKIKEKIQAEIIPDFKSVFKVDNKDEAKTNSTIYKNGAKSIRNKDSLQKTSNLFTNYDNPKSVNATIYMTNLVEVNNNQQKRILRKRNILSVFGFGKIFSK